MANRERSFKKRFLIGIPTLVLVVLVLLPHEIMDWSVICPKCLQHAYTHEMTFRSMSYGKRITLSQTDGGTTNPAGSGFEIPAVSPKTYEDIFGEPCDHAFERGSFKFKRAIFFGLIPYVHQDGRGTGWWEYRGRVAAVGGLFAAYGRIGDRALAKESYRLIDTVQPMKDPQSRPSFNRDLPAILTQFGEELTSATSAEEWRTANNGFAEKVKALKQ